MRIAIRLLPESLSELFIIIPMRQSSPHRPETPAYCLNMVVLLLKDSPFGDPVYQYAITKTISEKVYV